MALTTDSSPQQSDAPAEGKRAERDARGVPSRVLGAPDAEAAGGGIGSVSFRVKIADWFLRLLIASVFLDAGIRKLLDPQTFAEQIANYQLLSEWASYGAVLMPSLEVVAALVAIFGRRRWNRSATLVIMGMLVVFTLAIAQAWWRGINADCGCFGEGSTPIGIWTILRNSGLLLAGGLSFWLGRPRSDA